MGKDKINSKFSEYAKQLSPKPEERNMISEIYEKISEVLSGKCIQIGSYPRYTSITPVHDLDILYILWEWTEQLHNPAKALLDLETKLNHNFKNPTNYQTENFKSRVCFTHHYGQGNQLHARMGKRGT